MVARALAAKAGALAQRRGEEAKSSLPLVLARSIESAVENR
jgi:hypothetical protein